MHYRCPFVLSSIHLGFAFTVNRFSSRAVTSSTSFALRSSGIDHLGTKKKYNRYSTVHKMASMDSPSAQRNKDPIWRVLEPIFSELIQSKSIGSEIRVLEVAGGTGVHAEYFCRKALEIFKNKEMTLQWIPTDPDVSCQLSIDSNLQEVSQLENIVIFPASNLTLDENGAIENSDQWKGKMFDLIIWCVGCYYC